MDDQIPHFSVPGPVIEHLVAYLKTKPWGEVNAFIHALGSAPPSVPLPGPDAPSGGVGGGGDA